MLDIFNKLRPFFEDVFREISVREYARLCKISPPTASTILKKFAQEGLLLQRAERNLLLFRAKRDQSLLHDMAIAYWRNILKKSLEPLREKFVFKKMILFGSIAKGENTKESDIDLFVDMKHTSIVTFDIEKTLKRKIQFHFSDALHNKNLTQAIRKGVEI